MSLLSASKRCALSQMVSFYESVFKEKENKHTIKSPRQRGSWNCFQQRHRKSWIESSRSLNSSFYQTQFLTEIQWNSCSNGINRIRSNLHNKKSLTLNSRTWLTYSSHKPRTESGNAFRSKAFFKKWENGQINQRTTFQCMSCPFLFFRKTPLVISEQKLRSTSKTNKQGGKRKLETKNIRNINTWSKTCSQSVLTFSMICESNHMLQRKLTNKLSVSIHLRYSLSTGWAFRFFVGFPSSW